MSALTDRIYSAWLAQNGSTAPSRRRGYGGSPPWQTAPALSSSHTSKPVAGPAACAPPDGPACHVDKPAALPVALVQGRDGTREGPWPRGGAGESFPSASLTPAVQTLVIN